MLRCCIYKFHVSYKLSREELNTLEHIRDTYGLSDEEDEDWLERMRLIFNEEQERWGLWKLSRVRKQDVRNRMRG